MIAALRADVSGAAEPVTGDEPVGPGLLLWGEAYDGAWEDGDASGSARHVETFGWANGFEVERRRPVSLAFADQWMRWALLAVSLAIWIVTAIWWWRTRVRRERPIAGPRERGERRERRARPDPLAEVLDEDSFWWERV